MFTDLAGSTEMRSRLGEDAAEALRGVHDSILIDAIVANGGRVVKHLGDGFMAVFTSAAGAVSAAVGLQQELERANRRGAGERLRVRVGISTGDVIYDGGDCFGLPVVEAQRLEASAEPGTIRCAELVKHLARGRGGHEFVALGDLELKGLAEPLAACEVTWTPLDDVMTVADPEVGLPPVFAHGGGLPFSGRDTVFDQLVDAWKRCAAGGAEVVLLAGEPGIGKTRLAQELATRVHGGDGVVLAGRCDEDITVPFQAFAAALDWFVRQTPAEARLGSLGDHPGDLVRLVPDLGVRVEGLPAALRDDPDTERFRLFQAVASWLAVGGTQRPRLLVIDDLHWADKPTLLLLRHLIANPVAGLLVLCTYRDTDVDRTHPLSAVLADLRRMPAVTRIAVGGLGGDGVRELLVRTGGHDLDEAGLAFAELVHRETSGNPFFVGEVLRHLAETGALVERDGRWTSDLRPEDAGIPEGIREVVGRRLSRLGEQAEQVLRSAAVIGYEFDVDLLADVMGRDADEVLDALDAARAANLVVEVGVDRHRFAHALVRETLHGELSASRRARQHRKVAEAIEARYRHDVDAVLPELATHWAEATAGGDPSRAIELAVRAGEQAGERGAWENAVRWYQRALDLMDDDADGSERDGLMVALASAQANTGAVADARSTVIVAARSALARGDMTTVCAALWIQTRASYDANDPADPDKVALLRAALALPLVDDQRALMLGQLATELIFENDIDGRRRSLSELWKVLPSLPRETRAQLLGNLGTGYFVQTRASSVAVIEVSSDAIETGSRDVQRVAMVSRFGAFLALGRREELELARAEIERIRAIAPSRGDWGSSMVAAVLAVVDGDLDLASTSIVTMLDQLATWAVPEAANYRTTTAVMVARERRSLPKLGRLADVLQGLGPTVSAARALGAFIRLASGDDGAARAALDRVQVDEFADNAGYAVSAALWSEVAVAIGSGPQRRALCDALAPQHGVHLFAGGIYLGAADRLRARLHDRLGEHAAADGLFADAVRQHHDMRSPTWVARTELDWAESLLARGDSDAAVTHLDAAAAALGDLDLPDNQLRLAELRARFVR